jgi:hypothetical protein
MTSARKEGVVTLTPAVGGEKRTLTVKPKQLPMVCAVASTVYKVQGETLTSMVVADWKAEWKPGYPVHNKPEQAYITLSRVVNRDSFVTLKPFTKAHANYFKPKLATMVEDKRLETECNNYLKSDEVKKLFPAEDYAELLSCIVVSPDPIPKMSTAAKRRVKPSVTKAVPGLFTRLKEKYRRFQQQKQVHQPKQQMNSTAKPGLLARLKNKYGSKHQQEPNQQQQQQQEPIQHKQQQNQQPVVIEEWMLIESDLTQRSELVNAVRAFRDPTETRNAWLTDNSIDLHLQMILAQHNHNNVTFLSAQFYTRLTNPIFSYGDLRNWVNKLGVIFHSSTTDMKVIIPINYGSDHWVLSFLDFKTKQYSYYDSLQRERPLIPLFLENLLIEAHKDQDPDGGFSIADWTPNVLEGPLQTNWWDCGVFLSAAAKHLLLHDDLYNATFSQGQMPYLRQQMADELEPWWEMMNPEA